MPVDITNRIAYFAMGVLFGVIIFQGIVCVCEVIRERRKAKYKDLEDNDDCSDCKEEDCEKCPFPKCNERDKKKHTNPCYTLISVDELKKGITASIPNNDIILACGRTYIDFSIVRKAIDRASGIGYKLDSEPEMRWQINSDGYYPYCPKCGEEPKSGEMTDRCPNCGVKLKRYNNDN